MGRIPQELRDTIAANIRACRLLQFPGRGGAQRCARAFGVSPQQWSPWERGLRLPGETRLALLAKFFGVTVEDLFGDHSKPESPPHVAPNPAVPPEKPAPGDGMMRRAAAGPRPPSTPPISRCPFYRPPQPGQPPGGSVRSLCWLAELFLSDIRDSGITFRLHPDDIARIARLCSRRKTPPQ